MQGDVTPSTRAGRVEYAIRDVAVRAERLRKSGMKIIPLNVGDPVYYGFQTPQNIRDAFAKAMHAGKNYYSPSEGIPELRRAVAEKERRLNGADADPEKVLITAGITEAIQLLLGAILNPGDEALLQGPTYPSYQGYTKFFDATPVFYRTIEDDDWRPDVEDLENKITKRTRLIVIVNPNNPTGSVYSSKDLKAILDVAASQNIPVAADEIYDRIVFDADFKSVASLAKDTPIIALNGFSKAYLMTGWRLGYMYTQDPSEKLGGVWDAIGKLARLRICANTPAQYAAVEALQGPQDHITSMVNEWKRRRDYVLDQIKDVRGLKANKPRGAFYLFPRVLGVGSVWKSDREFSEQLLDEKGVLVVPGSGFDSSSASEHFRMVFLPEESQLSEACSKMREFINQYAPLSSLTADGRIRKR